MIDRLLFGGISAIFCLPGQKLSCLPVYSREENSLGSIIRSFPEPNSTVTRLLQARNNRAAGNPF